MIKTAIIMNSNRRLLATLATGSGALLLTYAALRYYLKRQRRNETKDEKDGSKDGVKAAPELRLDRSAEIITKNDLDKAQLISSTVGGSFRLFCTIFDCLPDVTY